VQSKERFQRGNVKTQRSTALLGTLSPLFAGFAPGEDAHIRHCAGLSAWVCRCLFVLLTSAFLWRTYCRLGPQTVLPTGTSNCNCVRVLPLFIKSVHIASMTSFFIEGTPPMFITKLLLRNGQMPRPGFRLILKTVWFFTGLVRVSQRLQSRSLEIGESRTFGLEQIVLEASKNRSVSKTLELVYDWRCRSVF